MNRAFVIGGGVSGLAAGELLAREGFHVTVFEATERTGGMAATIERDGFRFDMGPHKLYSPQPEPMAHVRELFPGGEGLLQVPKTSQLHFRGKSFEYPLSIKELLAGIPKDRAAAFAASFLAGRLSGNHGKSYADFMRRQFGRGLYDEVFGPAARKVFGADEQLSARLGEARFRGKSLATFVRQALGRDRARTVDVSGFLYPELGTGEVPARMRRRIEERGGRILTGSRVDALGVVDRHVAWIRAGGERIDVAPADAVIYTAPLADAPALLALPDAARDAAARLRYRLLVLVYLVLRRPQVMPNQWMFFPTEDVCFNRLSEPRNFSPAMAPPGMTSLVAEVTGEGDASGAFDAEAGRRVVADLVRIGMVREEEISSMFTERFVQGYPVWLVGFEDHREAVLSAMDLVRNLYPIGRQGLYQYVGILDCIDMALRTARFILSAVPHEGFTYLRQELQGYPVVD